MMLFYVKIIVTWYYFYFLLPSHKHILNINEIMEYGIFFLNKFISKRGKEDIFIK